MGNLFGNCLCAPANTIPHKPNMNIHNLDSSTNADMVVPLNRGAPM